MMLSIFEKLHQNIVLFGIWQEKEKKWRQKKRRKLAKGIRRSRKFCAYLLEQSKLFHLLGRRYEKVSISILNIEPFIGGFIFSTMLGFFFYTLQSSATIQYYSELLNFLQSGKYRILFQFQIWKAHSMYTPSSEQAKLIYARLWKITENRSFKRI